MQETLNAVGHKKIGGGGGGGGGVLYKIMQIFLHCYLIAQDFYTGPPFKTTAMISIGPRKIWGGGGGGGSTNFLQCYLIQ